MVCAGFDGLKRAPVYLTAQAAVFLLFSLLVCCTLLLLGVRDVHARSAYISLEDPTHVERIKIVVDKSRTLSTDIPFKQALVANPAIADVVPLTDQTIYVVGKSIGMTRLTLVDENKRLLGVVEIEVSYDIRALKYELRQSLPDGDFNVRSANGRLLIRGSVASAPALARAVDIIEQFTSNCNGTPRPAASSSQETDSNGQAGESRSVRGNGRKCYSNGLTVRAAQQVLLEVRFVEADRRAARDLGLAWNSRTGRFIGLTGLVPGVGGLPSGAIPFGQFVARLLDTGNTADVIIEALEKKGLARRLAEPNLVALSGDTANFLAGGEFPFPVQADDRRITIEFKKFGVGLAFTPTVLGNGQINLKISPEVSDIDENNILQLNNVTVPGLVVRRANTTVELRDGQSFAIAGLLQTKHKKNVSQLPWIGDVPVLGTLFRSASYEKQESDLVIIVTPRLVQPVGPGNVRLKTPLDDRLSSNDRDFFLRGKSEIKKQWISLFGHMLPGDGEWVTKVDDGRIPIGDRSHAAYK